MLSATVSHHHVFNLFLGFWFENTCSVRLCWFLQVTLLRKHLNVLYVWCSRNMGVITCSSITCFNNTLGVFLTFRPDTYLRSQHYTLNGFYITPLLGFNLLNFTELTIITTLNFKPQKWMKVRNAFKLCEEIPIFISKFDLKKIKPQKWFKVKKPLKFDWVTLNYNLYFYLKILNPKSGLKSNTSQNFDSNLSNFTDELTPTPKSN